jgi:hypothetical protein
VMVAETVRVRTAGAKVLGSQQAGRPANVAGVPARVIGRRKP